MRRFQTNVNILDSTGAAPYLGDVLVKGQRIVKVGGKLSPEELHDVRVFEGKGRTLMSGLGKSESPYIDIQLTLVHFQSTPIRTSAGWVCRSMHEPTSQLELSQTNSPSLEGLAEMPIEEHTIFSLKSARTFLDCGYTMCGLYQIYFCIHDLKH